MPNSDPWSISYYFLSQQIFGCTLYLAYNLTLIFIPYLKLCHPLWLNCWISLSVMLPKKKSFWLCTSLGHELQFLPWIQQKLNLTSQHDQTYSQCSDIWPLKTQICLQKTFSKISPENQHLFPLVVILSLLLCLLVVSNYSNYTLQKVKSSNEFFIGSYSF